jgi:hypothetical protein
MKVFQDGVAACFQPSLRDCRPFKSNPGLASWAKLRAVPAGLSLEKVFSHMLFSPWLAHVLHDFRSLFSRAVNGLRA